MESLEQLGPPAELPPLLAAGLEPVVSSNALWVKLQRAITERALTPRALQSLTVFRDLIVSLTEVATRDSVSITVGKMLDQSGYLHDLREDRSEEARGRIENLMELVSAAKEYESRDPEPSLGGFVDQLSLLSETDEEAGARDGPGLDDDHARGQGPRVPRGGDRRSRGRPVPALARLRGRGRTRGGAAALLRRHDTGAATAGVDRGREAADVRRVQVDQPVPVPRRGPVRVDRGGHRLQLGVPTQLRWQPAARRLRPAARTPIGVAAATRRVSAKPRCRLRPTRTRTSRRARARRIAPGARVRHAQFGLGTVISVEPLDGDAKIVVRFAIGQKTLRAKYARLQPA